MHQLEGMCSAAVATMGRFGHSTAFQLGGGRGTANSALEERLAHLWDDARGPGYHATYGY